MRNTAARTSKSTDLFSKLVRGTVYTDDEVSTIHLVTAWHKFDLNIKVIAFCVQVR